MPARRRESVVFTVVISVIAALAAIPIAIVLALSGGSSVVFLATAFALVPVGPVIACYLWLDRYEPEPKSLLATGLLWGMFVSTFLALLVQGIGGLVDVVKSPCYATGVGLVKYGAEQLRQQRVVHEDHSELPTRGGFSGRISQWFKEVF